MATLAGFLVFGSALILLLGLIRPGLVLPGVKQPTRPRVAIVAVLVFAAAIFIGANSTPGSDGDTAPASAQPSAPATPGIPTADGASLALATAVVDAMPKKPTWERVEIETATHRDFELVLHYRAPSPHSFVEVEADTKAIVRTLLAALVQSGRHPSDEWIDVSVSSERAFTGETGKALVELFGSASYNYNTDSVGFEAQHAK